MSGKIRLACRSCDRDDFDGIEQFPADWIDIIEDQSAEEAHAEVPESDRSRSVFDWHTHLGLCPECQQAEAL